MSNDFYSFERVLRELQMEEEELKRLVSEGEIRAFRDDEKMKFRREDVDRFRRLEDSETLGDDDVPEELVFDEDDADQEVGMATAAITDDAFLEEDDGGLELEEAPATKPRRGGGRVAAMPSPARKPRVTLDEPEESEGPVWATMIVLVAILTLFTALIVGDAVRAQPSSLSEGIGDWVDENFLDGDPVLTKDDSVGNEAAGGTPAAE